MNFEPIAVVGQSCLLPGAPDPESLWDAVRSGRDLIEPVRPGRWRVGAARILGESPEQAWSDLGGYVNGFEDLFDASGFDLPADELMALDPLFLWVLHTARDALRRAGVRDTRRTGAIFGNLSFPSDSMTTYAARAWLGDELSDAAGIGDVDPRNRFTSGLPAHVLARALSLGDVAFALDAACASSLYAIKFACDRLHDRKADVMLAGAVNRADDLFIHVGFTALQALSRSGRSRPFHRDADGLVPAEGAGFVVLKRLEDAEAEGDPIHGVIRSVGLSNDGRGAGFLAPSAQGQVRAMRQAYELASLEPDLISLVECHATGTVVGDATELRSMGQIFEGRTDIPIGSLKSNLGHAITVAGVAGLIKVLGAMKAGRRPPTLHADEPLEILQGSPFRLITEEEPWESDGPRIAAINAFGFGGNNAHLIVEEHTRSRPRLAPKVPESRPPVAVVGLGALVGNGQSREDFASRLFGESELAATADGIDLSLDGLSFPPKDLADTLPQQIMVLAACREALAGLDDLPRERTGVIVGMGCDPNVARYGARWRLEDWAAHWGVSDERWLAGAKDSVVGGLRPAGVLGTMPNIVTNRLNRQFDLGGPSLSISAEELSGIRALELAIRALQAREWDAAVVGAVDLSSDPVHQKALEALGITRPAGDAAVVLVLKRLDDARERQNPVLAVVDDTDATDPGAPLLPGSEALSARIGYAHSAFGLIEVAAAALQCGCGRKLGGEPWAGPRRARVELRAMEGARAGITVAALEGSDGASFAKAAPMPEGPSARYPGHWGAVHLPPLESNDSEQGEPEALEPNEGAVHVMELAPALVPVLAQHEGPAPTSPPAIRRAASTSPVAIRGAAPASPLPLALASHQRMFTDIHRQYLEQQTSAHRHFLDLRARASRLLLASASSEVATEPPELVGEATSSVPTNTVVSEARSSELPGPRFDRRQLEIHASGKISDVLGPLFRQQDDFGRQVRMPEPPLLLADRVVGLDAEPGSMKLGTIWTETDVVEDAWYLHDGRMPTGILVEAGQADLLLISYLGADFLNRGERAYRLLGCELTFHDSPPRVGETLRYEIHVDRHARQGDVRLFFFHYDSRVGDQMKLSVREGQAGFFTDEEMANSDGVLWSPETGEHCDSPRLDDPSVTCTRDRFSRESLEAFADGGVLECFGPGFEMASTHTRTPRIPGGRLLLLDEIAELNHQGGPWGRGYLRAVDVIEPDDWFFPGHFMNDPCMPGTLMFEGCLQAMAFYLTSMGHTLDKDGWRFEPVTDEPYLLRCRGQVSPSSRELVYEIYVEEVIGGSQPTLYADLLCTVDGLKAFHCRRMGLRLVPSWPAEDPPAEIAHRDDERTIASVDGFRFDYRSLLACALGPPSAAFGPRFRTLDGPRRVPRLPGPPYHFISRVTRVDGEMGSLVAGAVAEFEYDIPDDAWYFADNRCPVVPYCVLLEAALQPCGWLATFVGSTLQTDEDLFFRNLDGTGTQFAELDPRSGTLHTRVESTNISRAGNVLIESFRVTCTVRGNKVYEMQTTFGFFPQASLENQAGLPTDEALVSALTEKSAYGVDVTTNPERYCAGSLCLPEPSLRMIDRVTGYWPEGGTSGLGRVRTEKDVKAGEWSFKAHFFQDPVQPGSLGLEAMLQALKFAMLEKGMDAGITSPRFQPIALCEPLTWKYRGQVTIASAVVTTVLDIVDRGVDDKGAYALGKASLWVDGTRIYEASNLGMRIVPGAATVAEVLDPGKDSWILDHCPTYTAPALPLMSVVDRIAAAAAGNGRRVVGLTDVHVKKWLVLDSPTSFEADVRTSGDEAHVVLKANEEPIAEGRVTLGSEWPAPPEPFPELVDAEPADDPYRSAVLFHGPAFQVLRSLRIGASGSSAVLDAAGGDVPTGLLNQALLDGATHGIPHDALSRWSGAISDDDVAFPARLTEMSLHGPTPTSGEVRAEVRFDGFLAKNAFPAFRVQLIHEGRVWASFRLVEALFPKGPIGRAAPHARRDFLRGQYVEGVALSRANGPTSELIEADVKNSDWLPGTVEAIYKTRDPEIIVTKEHLARKTKLHPRWIPEGLPLSRFPTRVENIAGKVIVSDTGPEELDLTVVRRFWREWFDIGAWPVEDLYFALLSRFVRRIVLTDPQAFRALEGRNVLYLCNHQVGIESLLFSIVTGALTRVPTVTLAKIEHQTSWLGRLITHCFSYPGVEDPGTIRYFDRSDKASLPSVLAELGSEMKHKGRSVSIHVEGTRSLSCRQPVSKMSGTIIDLALATNAPIVPVRFVGGLPAEPLELRVEFPVGMGSQDYWLGTPLLPEELSTLGYAERKTMVIEAVNRLGPDASEEEPNPPDAVFAKTVEEWARQTGVTQEDAVLLRALEGASDVSEQTRRLLDRLPQPADNELGRWLAELARWLCGVGRSQSD